MEPLMGKHHGIRNLRKTSHDHRFLIHHLHNCFVVLFDLHDHCYGRYESRKKQTEAEKSDDAKTLICFSFSVHKLVIIHL
jgi:hypothetical protein